MDKNLPAKSMATIRELLESSDVQNEIKKALPDVLSADQLMRATVTLFRKTPKLLDCTQVSLLACFIGSAQLGLTTDPILGQVYWVPFWNSNIGKKGGYEATLIPGYRGLIELAMRSGKVVSVEGRAVFENQPFEINFGLHPRLDHGVAKGDPGPLIGAYTKWVREGGFVTFDYMNLWEIDLIMERTKSRDKNGEIVGPWKTDKPAMAIKSVIRRHWKFHPISIEDQRLTKAIEIDDNLLEYGPGSQKDFFLPDTGPLTIPEGKDSHAEFELAVGEVILRDLKFSEFMAITSKANNLELSEVEIQALDNIDAFKAAFKSWLSQQAQGEKKTAEPSSSAEDDFIREWNFIRDPKRLKEYVVANLDRFEKSFPSTRAKAQDKYSRIVKEPWPQKQVLEAEVVFDPRDKQNGPVYTSAELSLGGNESDTGELSFDDLVQSDEWQEMSVLKEQHPDIFRNITAGQVPRTIEGVLDVIAKISDAVDKLTADGEGIPGA
jgi:recombination protein RecT